MNEQIIIYHTNDLHSHFQYWPRIRQKLLKQKKIHKELHESMFLFDIGDHLDRFHPFTEATLGKGNVRLLNDVGFHAVTIGNNEGITLSHQDLLHLYDEAQFDCIVANLYDNEGNRPHWAKPYTIYETLQKTKIGVIGVTINFTNFYEPLDWVVTNPFAELEKWIPIVREKVDVLIILSHLGLSDDERIAEQFPQVDVILGAHTHHILPEGKWVNGCLLCCTGKFGLNLGKVELLLNHEKKTIKKRAELIPSRNLDKEDQEENFDQRLIEEGKELLSNPVAYLPKKLETDWFHHTELNQLLCASLTEWCEADCSFLNAGVLLDHLGPGIVTDYDIHRICPHPINPCTVRLTGAELKEVIVQTVDDKYTTLEIKGFGFRGSIFGKIIYDQIEISGQGSAIKIQINGEDLQMERNYTVATLDMFTFARFYPEITRAEKKYYLPEFLRDLLRWKLKCNYPVKSEY